MDAKMQESGFLLASQRCDMHLIHPNWPFLAIRKRSSVCSVYAEYSVAAGHYIQSGTGKLGK